ncbi:aldose epimerase [Pyxidicoccus fallax]|uniref:Aldose epimerase n=1 Tax=Pyxidicoccus fallax TaxID=394095 RepID=A0A848LKS6_9BACT|nr:aldose epimerase [Pyxidicoccus fallax]NMO18319.1 aldose epimerase [Pyxidicoccus fallax]NPC84737.1 aldose epimerase [Pyxidicoccus fallax]
MSGPFPGIAGLDTYALVDGGCRVEVIPSRGALVTRMTVDGDEVFYLDEATVADPAKNVRGGIPVLFPNAGPLPGDTYPADGESYSLPQHGFARKLPWKVRQAEDSLLVVGLSSTVETRRQFPWRFDAQLTFSLVGTRLTLAFDVENQDPKPMPLHLGYHPYFRVPEAMKARAGVETNATHAWDNRVKQEVPYSGLDLTADEVDLHLRDHSKPGTTLERGPGSRPVRLSWSPEFRLLVVWTLKGKDFVCVEPWTAAAGALATGQGLLHVKPGDRASLVFDIEA